MSITVTDEPAEEAAQQRKQYAPRKFGDVPPEIGLKSHFTIERWGVGWAITVRRRGEPPHTILTKTEGEANQHRLALSASGLPGFVAGGDE